MGRSTADRKFVVRHISAGLPSHDERSGFQISCLQTTETITYFSRIAFGDSRRNWRRTHAR